MTEYTHILSLGTSSNRRQTLSTLAIIVREVPPDSAKRRIVFRHSEARWHPRGEDAEEFAILRALELALEHGYISLLFQSPYYNPRRRRDGRRRGRYDDWEPALRARLDELAAKFAFLRFGPPPKTERAARALARRARATPPARPRADPNLNPDVAPDNWIGMPFEDDWLEDTHQDDDLQLYRFDPAEVPF
jgi:hypothetical protein